MWEIGNHFKVKIGGNTYIDIPTIISFKGQSLFSFKRDDETGYLGIYFDIYDAHGHKAASVKRNEIYCGNKEKYRIEGSLDRYVFSEQSTGRVICDIRKRADAHPTELDVSVHLYLPDGSLFNANTEQTNWSGIMMKDCTFTGAPDGSSTAININ